MSRGPRSITRWSELSDLASVDAGPEASPFQLSIHVHIYKRPYSLSGAATTTGPPTISMTDYMYRGYWETSLLALPDDNLDLIILHGLHIIPVDIVLYDFLGQKIRSGCQHLRETAGGRNLRVAAHIRLLIDEIDEELAVDTEAVLEDGEWMGKDGGACSVCLEDFVEGEKVAKILTCGHCFHKDCIVTWLTREKNTCPLCRNAV